MRLGSLQLPCVYVCWCTGVAASGQIWHPSSRGGSVRQALQQAAWHSHIKAAAPASSWHYSLGADKVAAMLAEHIQDLGLQVH